jgi:hypothetical protein
VPQLGRGADSRSGEVQPGLDGRAAALVPQYHAGVLYVDGKVAKLLDAGMPLLLEVPARAARRDHRPAAAGDRSGGPGDPDQGQGAAAREPERWLPRDRRARGVREAGEAGWTTCTRSCSSACALQSEPAPWTSCSRTRCRSTSRWPSTSSAACRASGSRSTRSA